jgi:hypothetical protein
MAQKMTMGITAEDLNRAEDVEIIEEEDHWNKYKLKDGSVIKIKLIVKEISRLTTKWQPDGNPIYLINSQNIIRMSQVPMKLKAKPKEPGYRI